MQTPITVAVMSLLSVMTISASTWAQQAAPARPLPAARTQAPVVADSDEPQSTSASFGDWVERCQKIRAGAENLRVCEAAQTILVEGQNGPAAELAVGHIKKTDPLRVTLVLPVNVGFPSAPKLLVEGKPAATVELAWRRCIPGGCVADGPISDQVLALWRVETVQGRLEALTGAAQSVQLSFSFKGLAQALTALAKEDR